MFGNFFCNKINKLFNLTDNTTDGRFEWKEILKHEQMTYTQPTYPNSWIHTKRFAKLS